MNESFSSVCSLRCEDAVGAVNASFREEFTPLHALARAQAARHQEWARLLLGKMADVNRRTKVGSEMPLHIAVKNRKAHDMVRALHEHTDASGQPFQWWGSLVWNSEEKTPLDVAVGLSKEFLDDLETERKQRIWS